MRNSVEHATFLTEGKNVGGDTLLALSRVVVGQVLTVEQSAGCAEAEIGSLCEGVLTGRALVTVVSRVETVVDSLEEAAGL